MLTKLDHGIVVIMSSGSFIYFRSFLVVFIITYAFNNNVLVAVSSFQPNGGITQLVRKPHRQKNLVLLSSSSSSSSSPFPIPLQSRLSPLLEFELKPSITSIPKESWNSCLTIHNNEYSSSPFLEYSWLASLEESQCASSSTGWMPSHIQIKFIDNINNANNCCENLNDNYAYVPLYIKNNSNGEFIFDGEWARYASSLDISYYPKVLCGIPFTPVTCSKILMSPGFKRHLLSLSSSSGNESMLSTSSSSSLSTSSSNVDDTIIQEFRSIVAQYIQSIAASSSNKLSSVHINFIPNDEAYDIAGPTFLTTTTTTPTTTTTTTSYNQDDNNNNNDDTELINTKTKVLESVINPSISSQQQQQQHQSDYFRRITLQYHWQNSNPNNHNLPYTSFNEYLSNFKSKKRITIKRERKRVYIDQNIIVDVIEGKDIRNVKGDFVRRMFDIYKSTVEKQFFVGNQYLTLEFFERLVESDFIDYLVFFCARQRKDDDDDDNTKELDAKDIFAGTFNVVKDKVFYGRYWGCLPEYDIKNLHFEVCYWSAIGYCIQNGFVRMEPGAGSGDYKWARGFDPVLIHSAHYIADPTFRKAVKEYVEFDSERNMALSRLLNEQSKVQ